MNGPSNQEAKYYFEKKNKKPNRNGALGVVEGQTSHPVKLTNYFFSLKFDHIPFSALVHAERDVCHISCVIEEPFVPICSLD